MLPFLLACVTAEPEAPASAPETPELSTPALAQSLYAGEWGAAAKPQGERVRTLLWIRRMELDREQQSAFCLQVTATQARMVALQAELDGMAQAEAEALAPTSDKLEAALLQGPLTDEQAQSLAEEREAARSALPTPLALKSQAIRETVSASEDWLSALSPAQQLRAGEAVFVLRDTLDAGQSKVPRGVQDPWEDGDFATLQRARDPQAAPTDLGALFTLEDGALDLLSTLNGDDRAVLTAMLMAQPASAQVCAALFPPQEPTP